MSITGTDDHTAINCLTQNDWRLDMATDNFYQDPLKYYVEAPRAPVDKKKIDSLFTKYRSELHVVWSLSPPLEPQLVLTPPPTTTPSLFSTTTSFLLSHTLPHFHPPDSLSSSSLFLLARFSG